MKTVFTLFLITLISTASPGFCYGQADSASLDNLSLKELLNIKITTASKTSQSLELASADVTVITNEQIRSRGYQSLLDVLYDLRDIKVDDKMYSGMRNSFTVRGTQGSEKFIILLDGINISSPSGEAMAIMQNYPVHLAEQIEVLYGPASALYGANAVSGIINIISKKVRKNLQVEATTTSGDYHYTNTTLYVSKRIGDKARIFVSGQYYYDAGPDYSKIYKDDSLASVANYSTGILNTIYGSFAPVVPVRPDFESPMEAYNIYAGFYSGNFSFNYFRNYFKIPTAFGNNPGHSIFNKDVFMGQSISVANAAYKKTFKKITSSTSISASEYNLDPASNYRNLYTAMEPGYKYSTCNMVKLEEQVDYKHSEKLSVTAGAGIEYYTAIPQSGDLAGPVDTDGFIKGSYLGTNAHYRPEGLPARFYFIKYNNTGSFFQLQYSPGKKFNITAGARYDMNSRYGDSFNPRMGIVYKPEGHTTIKLLYGSAFRAPSPSEAYAQYGSFETTDSGRTYHSQFLHLPNPGLRPIESHNTEINLQRRFSDNIFISVDAYYTALRGLYSFSDDNQSTRIYNNMFDEIPVDYIEVFTNNDRQKNYGGSIQLNFKHMLNSAKFNSYASLSFVDGVKETGLRDRDEKDKDMELDFISHWMFHAGTDFKLGKFSGSPRLTLVSRQHVAGIGDTTSAIIKRQTIPGYALLNISLRYQISDAISVYTNISNALNQEYRNVSFNMDLERKETELYHGQPQDPFRIMGGIQFIL